MFANSLVIKIFFFLIQCYDSLINLQDFKIAQYSFYMVSLQHGVNVKIILTIAYIYVFIRWRGFFEYSVADSLQRRTQEMWMWILVQGCRCAIQALYQLNEHFSLFCIPVFMYCIDQKDIQGLSFIFCLDRSFLKCTVRVFKCSALK